jgi:iron-sulfur cluster assembly accessory protein
MFHLRQILAAQSNLRKPIIEHITKTTQQQRLQQPIQFARLLSTSSISSQKEQVTISDSCVKRLKELRGAKKEDKFLRVTVDSGGCSGFEYKFSIDTQIAEEDEVIEKDECKVLIDTESLQFLKGSTIDYYEEIIRAGFRIIDNPNSEQACSCGTSFSVKL